MCPVVFLAIDDMQSLSCQQQDPQVQMQMSAPLPNGPNKENKACITANWAVWSLLYHYPLCRRMACPAALWELCQHRPDNS